LGTINGHKVFARWLKLLDLSGSRSKHICEQHFTEKDFICIILARVITSQLIMRQCHLMMLISKNAFTVTSKYLRPNAVPSKISRLPLHIMEHNYSNFTRTSRSNRICFVDGCGARAIKDAIHLHNFPPKSKKQYKAWLNILKCSRTPTANSKVCSLHFKKTDYVSGCRLYYRKVCPIIVRRVYDIMEH
ncbi:uncharacterized protein LOC129728853, partial [Wyeomyia smithii]|uniref:uncharacterized protein LOC129728853 n=1 Tax=Wyeomyia smithii TaxID=174621 RepID=UPI002467DB75